MSLATIFRVLTLSCVLAPIAGCHDSRISVHDFIRLQQMHDAEERQPTQAHAKANPERRRETPILLTMDVSSPQTRPEQETPVRKVSDEDPGNALSRVAAALTSQPYRIGSGDVLRLSFVGLGEITEPTEVLARVDRQDRIALPLVGELVVGDKPLDEVEDLIRSAYVPQYLNSLSVAAEVQTFKSTDVIVRGAVELPGLVRLRRDERDVIHAVASAGGMSQDASGVIVLRRLSRPGEVITLNLLSPLDLEAAMGLEPLDDNDAIEVQAAMPNTIFVGGLVNAPGPKIFPPGTSVNLMQILAAAGGVLPNLYPKDATLVRRMPDGKDVQVKVELEKLQNDPRYPNIQLAAGDIFWVPETVGTKFMEFFNNTFFLRAGATVSYNVTGVEFLNRRSVQNGSANTNNSIGTLQNRVDPLGFLVPR